MRTRRGRCAQRCTHHPSISKPQPCPPANAQGKQQQQQQQPGSRQERLLLQTCLHALLCAAGASDVYADEHGHVCHTGAACRQAWVHGRPAHHGRLGEASHQRGQRAVGARHNDNDVGRSQRVDVAEQSVDARGPHVADPEAVGAHVVCQHASLLGHALVRGVGRHNGHAAGQARRLGQLLPVGRLELEGPTKCKGRTRGLAWWVGVWAGGNRLCVQSWAGLKVAAGAPRSSMHAYCMHAANPSPPRALALQTPSPPPCLHRLTLPARCTRPPVRATGRPRTIRGLRVRPRPPAVAPSGSSAPWPAGVRGGQGGVAGGGGVVSTWSLLILCTCSPTRAAMARGRAFLPARSALSPALLT